MYFCSAEECALCAWAEGSGECLQKQSRRYARLSRAVKSRGLHDALRELSLDLAHHAATRDRERRLI